MSGSGEVTLVTGACGFVGSALCDALVREGQTVVAVDDLTVGRPWNWAADVAPEIALERIDVRDQAGLKAVLARHRPSTVYHLAAIHYIPACDADPARAISVNVEGTQSLLTACASIDLSCVVLASTGAVYAPSLERHSEDDLLAPTDIYGLTKLWMEQAAELHHRRTGMPVGVGRLFNVVGRGETNPHLVPEVIAQAAKSSKLQLGNLTTRRDYIHVDDIAAGLQAIGAVAGKVGHLVCNLGAERAIDGHELVNMIAQVIEQDLTVEVDASKLRVSDRPVLEADCTRARDALGWEPQVSLESALRDAVARPLAGTTTNKLVRV